MTVELLPSALICVKESHKTKKVITTDIYQARSATADGWRCCLLCPQTYRTGCHVNMRHALNVKKGWHHQQKPTALNSTWILEVACLELLATWLAFSIASCKWRANLAYNHNDGQTYIMAWVGVEPCITKGKCANRCARVNNFCRWIIYNSLSYMVADWKVVRQFMSRIKQYSSVLCKRHSRITYSRPLFYYRDLVWPSFDQP